MALHEQVPLPAEYLRALGNLFGLAAMLALHRGVRPHRHVTLGNGLGPTEDPDQGIEDLVDLALARGGYAHNRFVRLDIDDFLIVYNLVTGFDLDIDDGRFGDPDRQPGVVGRSDQRP